MEFELVDSEQAAAILGVERSAVEAAAAHGVIAHRRFGKRMLFLKSRVMATDVSLVRNFEIGADGDAIARIKAAADDMRRRIDALCKPTNVTPNPYLDGYVYAIRPLGAPVPIKIGKAVDPVDRLANIQRMNPWPLELIGMAHGARNEGALHQEHHERRLHGEWFGIDENPLPIGDSCRICGDR